MHIPDGFINVATSVGAGAVSAAGVTAGVRQTAKTLDKKRAPLAGLVAAFIFAVQMLNFPVAAGTSGHLLGGTLAAVLVGPWAGMLAMTVVLTVQALVFADGGLVALGLNVLNMAIIGTLAGYGLFVLIRKVVRRTRSGVAVAAGVAAFLSVPIAATAFVVEYAIGGTGDAPVGTVLAAMAGVHLLIGIGEGVITAMVVGAVLAVRPDLVYGASDLLPAVVAPARAEGART
jgi:cobalt/nickel transport system permease protein